MKMLKIFLVFFLFFFIKWYANAADLVYPIQEMSKVECRFQSYSSLWSDCKMKLPILKTKDYEKYKNDYSLYRRVYTVLWAWSYTYGWDVWNGWHQWVDIASAAWTPVHAMTDWEVVVASFLTWRWNTVKIKHVVNGKTIYSNYSHLLKIGVSVWDKVKAWEKIWEVWSTWNSTWNHLHFQIDLTSASGPWYRKNCRVNYDSAVNSSTCYDELNSNTVDPLLFLETNGAIVKSSGVVEKPKQEKISTSWLLSREEILKREIQEFLNKYKVSVSIVDFWSNILLWEKWTLRVKVVNKYGRQVPFNWSFPWNMNFKYDSNKFDLFPVSIYQIDDWYRDIKITPKMSGKMSIDVYIWETFYKRINFWVINGKNGWAAPKTMASAISTSNVLSENKTWVLYFKDNFWINLLWVPFKWTYKITSNDGEMKFCIKKASSLSKLKQTFNSSCREEYFKSEVTFDYSDSTEGIILFDYKVLDTWNHSIVITSTSWELIWLKWIKWTIAKSLSTKYDYYEEIVSISKLWIPTWINKWYFLQDRELTQEDGVNFIKNSLSYLSSKCSNQTCKSLISEYKIALSKAPSSRYEKLSRYEFAELIEKYLPISYNWNYMVYRDLDEKEQEVVKKVLKWETWKDKFWETRYFQPQKTITRGEAAFLISSALDL